MDKINILQEWTGFKCSEIVFDSNVDNWDVNTSVFDEKIMGKKTFLKGAAVLGIAGLLTQVLGAVFRIPLANIIGTEGMAYYGAAYTIYVFLLVFSTNGAPAAISKMTSERIALGKYKDAHRVFKYSFILLFPYFVF